MSLSHKIKALRAKPQHVRERILLVSLAILAPVLLGLGAVAFMYERSQVHTETVIDFKELGNYFSGTVSDLKGTAAGFKSGMSSGSDPVASQ